MRATKHLHNRPARKRAVLFEPVDVAGLIGKCRRSGRLTYLESDLLRKFARLANPPESAWRIFWEVCRKCGVEE